MALNRSQMLRLDHLRWLLVMDGAGHYQCGSLNLLDGINILLNDGVDDGFVKAVGGSHNDEGAQLTWGDAGLTIK